MSRESVLLDERDAALGRVEELDRETGRLRADLAESQARAETAEREAARAMRLCHALRATAEGAIDDLDAVGDIVAAGHAASAALAASERERDEARAELAALAPAWHVAAVCDNPATLRAQADALDRGVREGAEAALLVVEAVNGALLPAETLALLGQARLGRSIHATHARNLRDRADALETEGRAPDPRHCIEASAAEGRR